MKRHSMVSAVDHERVLSVCAFAFQATSAQPKAQKAPAKAAAPMQTFVGVITDGQCAVKGSHKEVMAKAKVNTASQLRERMRQEIWLRSVCSIDQDDL